MSKSLEFCKARAKNKEISSFFDRDWDNAREMESLALFERILEGKRKYKIAGEEDGEAREFTISLVFDPDADFDYFTSSCSVHDGTLMFMFDNMEKCAKRVIIAETYYTKKGKPQAGDTIQYTIGNFVVLNEFDANGDLFYLKEKPYLMERTTVLLPLRYDLIKGE